MKRSLTNGKGLDWTIYLLFVIIYVVIAVFHEPWYDEAEAWQIAKCASLKEILFDIPHVEGHPALWHLLLAIPAKLGVPYETVGGVITCTAAWLMMFQSKLPRLVRLSVPFTYFFFYQYGVIVRPYGLLLLFLLLVGMNLNERREHPWRMAVLLGCLCCTHAYGLLFAAGFAACILLELYREKGLVKLLRELLSDPRTASLCVLLAWALLIIAQIYPSPDAFATAEIQKSPFVLRMLCMFFSMLAECFLSTSSWFGRDTGLVQVIQFPVGEFLPLVVIGAFLWLALICASSPKTLKYLVLPYTLLAGFAAIVYFSTHHLGVIFLLILCWAEFISRSDDHMYFGKKLLERIAKSDRDRKLLKRATILFSAACIAVPLYWTVSASVHDVQYEYCYGRSAASFILKNHLENCKILCRWFISKQNISQDEALYINTNITSDAVPLVAYLPENVIINLNNCGEDAYVHHRQIDSKDVRKELENWREAGAPDLIVNRPELEMVYGESLTFDDYSMVWEGKTRSIWKDAMTSEISVIYLRNDLLSEYGLEKIEDPWFDYWMNGAPITQEMRERYKNGESIEDIIDPILDAMFGPESKKK